MNENVCNHYCFPFSKSLLQMQIKVQRIVCRNKYYFMAYLWGIMHARILDTGQGLEYFQTQHFTNGSLSVIKYKAPTELHPY